jgi:hypothetical protein
MDDTAYTSSATGKPESAYVALFLLRRMGCDRRRIRAIRKTA